MLSNKRLHPFDLSLLLEQEKSRHESKATNRKATDFANFVEEALALAIETLRMQKHSDFRSMGLWGLPIALFAYFF